MNTPGQDRPSGWWFPARTTAYFLVVAAVSLATLSLLGLREINSTNEMNSSVRIDRAGRAAAALLDESVSGVSLDIDAEGSPSAIILADSSALEPGQRWDELLDTIGGVNQGAANLFRFDETTESFDRLSTTFRAPDGARAGGSQVEPGLIVEGHPAYASLAAGNQYIGEVPVAGRLRLAYLTPILTSDGATAGILAVDVGWVDDLNRMTAETTDRAIATSLSLLVILALVCVLVMFRSFRPLHRLTEAAHAIGMGDHDGTIGLTDRRDEIGYLARGLVKVSDLQKTLEHQAYNDSLTSVPNRAALVKELDRRFSEIDGEDDASAFALLIIDLDGFKEVNDGLGHQAGDELLMALARSLRDSLQPGEYFARLGGDEFALLSATNPNIEDHVAELTERASLSASGVFNTSAGDACVSASIGVALIPQHGVTSQEAMRNADLALYEVKRGERGTTMVYDESFSEAFDRQLYLVSELRRVLDNEELTLAYQPLYDMDGNVRALEGLARWQDADGGPISPAEFIPIAENVGLIDQLGGWVLNEACRQITEWAAVYDNLPKIAINVSTLQLRNPDFVDSMARLLDEYPAAQGHLCLELTESVLVPGKGDWHRPVLAALTELGICLSIDDFGTGYSSLNYLHELVVDQVKIDRTFIDAAIDDDKQRQLLAGIVGLGNELGLSVVLEGIETTDELALARTLGCDLLQGYLLGKPMNPDMVAARFGVPHHHFAEANDSAAAAA